MQIKVYVFKEIRFISDLCSITCLFLIALVAAGLKGHCPLVTLSERRGEERERLVLCGRDGGKKGRTGRTFLALREKHIFRLIPAAASTLSQGSDSPSRITIQQMPQKALRLIQSRVPSRKIEASWNLSKGGPKCPLTRFRRRVNL